MNSSKTAINQGKRNTFLNHNIADINIVTPDALLKRITIVPPKKPRKSVSIHSLSKTELSTLLESDHDQWVDYEHKPFYRKLLRIRRSLYRIKAAKDPSYSKYEVSKLINYINDILRNKPTDVEGKMEENFATEFTNLTIFQDQPQEMKEQMFNVFSKIVGTPQIGVDDTQLQNALNSVNGNTDKIAEVMENISTKISNSFVDASQNIKDATSNININLNTGFAGIWTKFKGMIETPEFQGILAILVTFGLRAMSHLYGNKIFLGISTIFNLYMIWHFLDDPVIVASIGVITTWCDQYYCDRHIKNKNLNNGNPYHFNDFVNENYNGYKKPISYNFDYYFNKNNKNYDSEDDLVWTEQADWGQDDTENVVYSILGVTYYSIFRKHAAIGNFTGFIKEFGGLSKLKEGLKGGVDSVVEILSKLLKHFNDFFGLDGELRVHTNHPDIDEVVKEVDKIIIEARSPDFTKGSTNAERVFAIDKKLNKLYCDTYSRDAKYSSVRDILRQLLFRMKDLKEHFESLSKANDSTRQVPTGIMFAGPPGIGKTFKFKMLVEDVGVSTVPESRLHCFGKASNDEVWNFVPGMNFHNGAKDCHIMLMDEFGAMNDAPGTNTTGVIDLLYMMTENAFLLNRAGILEKDNTYFRCKIVFCTTNRTSYKELDSLFSKDALARRFIHVCMVPKEEFCIPGTYHGEKDLDSLMKRRLRTEEDLPVIWDGPLEGTPDMEIYEYFLFNPGTTSGPSFRPITVLRNVRTGYTPDGLSIFEDRKIQTYKLTDTELTNLIINTYNCKTEEYERSSNTRSIIKHFSLVKRLHNSGQLDDPKWKDVLAPLELNNGYRFVFDSTTDDWRKIPLSIDELKERRPIFKEQMDSKELQLMVDQMALKTGSTPEKLLGLLSEECKRRTYSVTTEIDIPYAAKLEMVKAKFNDFKGWCADFKLKEDNKISQALNKLKDLLANPKVQACIALLGAFGTLWYFVRNHLSEQSVDWHQKVRGNSRTARRAMKGDAAKRLKEMTSALKPQGYNLTQGGEDLANGIWRKNLFSVQFEGKHCGYGLFIKGRTFIVPKHYVREFDKLQKLKENFQITLVSVSNKAEKYPIEWRSVKTFCHPEIDVAAVLCPKVINERSTLVHHFTSIEGDLGTDTFWCSIIWPNLTTKESVALWPTSAEFVENVDIKSDDSTLTSVSARAYLVKVITKVGDCGLPYIVTDQYQEPKIMGIHVAGNGSNAGMVAAIFKEDIDLLLSGLPATVDTIKPLDTNPFHLQMDFSGEAVVIGTTKTINRPFKSEKVRSPFYGCFGPPKNMPTITNRKKVDGKWVDPMEKAFTHYHAAHPNLNVNLWNKCAASYHRKILNSVPHDYEPQVYDFVTTVIGKPGIFDSISRNSSAGYPYNINKINRKDIFGDAETFDLKNTQALKLQEDVLSTISRYEKLQFEPIYQTAHLKSEVKSIEKVLQLNTRLFSAGGLKNYIIERMYLLDFVRYLIDGRIKNGMTLGINPYSIEWDILARTIIAKGDNVLSCDFKKYDWCVFILAWYSMQELVESYYYNSTQEERNVRHVIFQQLMEPIYLLTIYFSQADLMKIQNPEFIVVDYDGKPVIEEVNEFNRTEANELLTFQVRILGSLASGLFLTAAMGSYNGNVIIRYAICDSLFDITNVNESTLLDFDYIENNFSIQTNGDDNLIAVTDLAKSRVDFQKLQTSLAKIGYTYTDENKTTGEEVTWRKLKDVRYLKRSFIINDHLGRYLGSLPLDNLLQSLYYCTRGCKKVDLELMLEANIKELSLHGKTVFEDIINKFIKAARLISYYPKSIVWEEVVAEVTLSSYLTFVVKDEEQLDYFHEELDIQFTEQMDMSIFSSIITSENVSNLTLSATIPLYAYYSHKGGWLRGIVNYLLGFIIFILSLMYITYFMGNQPKMYDIDIMNLVLMEETLRSPFLLIIEFITKIPTLFSNVEFIYKCEIITCICMHMIFDLYPVDWIYRVSLHYLWNHHIYKINNNIIEDKYIYFGTIFFLIIYLIVDCTERAYGQRLKKVKSDCSDDFCTTWENAIHNEFFPGSRPTNRNGTKVVITGKI